MVRSTYLDKEIENKTLLEELLDKAKKVRYTDNLFRYEEKCRGVSSFLSKSSSKCEESCPFRRLSTGKLYNPQLPPIVVILHDIFVRLPDIVRMFGESGIVVFPYSVFNKDKIEHDLKLPQVVAFFVHYDLLNSIWVLQELLLLQPFFNLPYWGLISGSGINPVFLEFQNKTRLLNEFPGLKRIKESFTDPQNPSTLHPSFHNSRFAMLDYTQKSHIITLREQLNIVYLVS